MSSDEYQARYGRKTIPKLNQNTKSTSIKLGRSSLSEPIVSDSIEKGEGWCRITLAGLIHGLNGSKGLQFSHWTARRKEKEKMLNRIKALNPPIIKGQISVTLTRYGSRLLDWDNLASTGKFPLDGLKNAEVIEDDSPKYIIEFFTKQVKCRRKDAKTEILIKSTQNGI